MGVEEDLQDYRSKHHKAYLERKRRGLLATGATIGPPPVSPPPEPLVPQRSAQTFTTPQVQTRPLVSPTGVVAQNYKYTPPAPSLQPSTSQDKELARRLQEEEDAKLARSFAEPAAQKHDLDGVRAPDHSYRETLLGDGPPTLTHNLLGHPVDGREETGRSPPPLPPSRITQYAPVISRAYGQPTARQSGVVRTRYGVDDRSGFNNNQTRVVEEVRHRHSPERLSNPPPMQPSPLSPAHRQTSPLHPRTYFKSSSPPSGSDAAVLTPSPIQSDLDMSDDDQLRRAIALSKMEHEASLMKDRKF